MKLLELSSFYLAYLFLHLLNLCNNWTIAARVRAGLGCLRMTVRVLLCWLHIMRRWLLIDLGQLLLLFFFIFENFLFIVILLIELCSLAESLGASLL